MDKKRAKGEATRAQIVNAATDAVLHRGLRRHVDRNGPRKIRRQPRRPLSSFREQGGAVRRRVRGCRGPDRAGHDRRLAGNCRPYRGDARRWRGVSQAQSRAGHPADRADRRPFRAGLAEMARDRRPFRLRPAEGIAQGGGRAPADCAPNSWTPMPTCFSPPCSRSPCSLPAPTIRSRPSGWVGPRSTSSSTG